MAEGNTNLPSEFTFTTKDDVKLTSVKNFTGVGKAEYTNGDVYEGEYTDGQKDGHGVYTHVNGDVYDGNFRANKKHGFGTLTYKAGGKYTGNYVNGKREGEGSMKYANGDIYIGGWKEGRQHGEGTYAFADSRSRCIGVWVEGKIQKGEYAYKNNFSYKGIFRNNTLCGDGQYSFPNGNLVDVTFSQKKVLLEEKERSLRQYIGRKNTSQYDYQLSCAINRVHAN